MDHAQILSFLNGTLSPEDFAIQIAPEVTACVEGCRSVGIGHIIMAEGPLTMVRPDHAMRLLQALWDQRLPFDAANYLADSLIMADQFDFASPAVADAIGFVADDSRPPTRDEMREAMRRLA